MITTELGAVIGFGGFAGEAITATAIHRSGAVAGIWIGGATSAGALLPAIGGLAAIDGVHHRGGPLRQTMTIDPMVAIKTISEATMTNHNGAAVSVIDAPS